MARSRIPDPLTRRHLIERELAPAQALAIAEAYLAQGRSVEALEFLRKAGAEDRLQALRRQAVEEGDAFLLRAVAAQLGVEPEGREWRALALAAEAAGKPVYAAQARRHAEVGEE